MSEIAIRVDNLSVRYRLGQREQYKTLRDALTRGFTALSRHLHSTCQLANVQVTFRALKDVSFEVKRGEAVGIIGRKGAGKSILMVQSTEVE
ncbi:MAG TPA: ATP-binding cassette domain-containing protein [Candidatus Fraserbacteria bacterium]|nr:ATP-binding cassette domain-containing protein [Candidatus Fraserbacteria bacterium]